MAPHLQGLEMDNVSRKAEDRDPESLQQILRGLSSTKSWKVRVRIPSFTPVKMDGKLILPVNRAIELVLV